MAFFRLLAILQAAPGGAAPQSWPNGPWVVPEQEMPLNAVRDYPQLIVTLENYNSCREKYGLLPVSTLPPFPSKPGAPGPGETLDGEAVAQIICEHETA